MPEGLSTHLRATAGRALPPYQDGSAHYCFAQQPSSVVIGCRGTSPQVGMPAADKDSLSFANPLTGTSSGTFDREQQQSSVRSMRAAVLATDPKAWTSGLVADVVTHGATAQERLETHANAVFARIFRAISRKTSSLRQGDVIEGMVAIARMWHFCDRVIVLSCIHEALHLMLCSSPGKKKSLACYSHRLRIDSQDNIGRINSSRDISKTCRPRDLGFTSRRECYWMIIRSTCTGAKWSFSVMKEWISFIRARGQSVSTFD